MYMPGINLPHEPSHDKAHECDIQSCERGIEEFACRKHEWRHEVLQCRPESSAPNMV